MHTFVIEILVLRNRRSQGVLLHNKEIIRKTKRESCWVNKSACTRRNISSVKIRKKQSRRAGEPPVTSIMTQKYFFTGRNRLVSERGKINTHIGLCIVLVSNLN